MKKGIARNLDELGRITLPMEYRKTAGISTDDRVGIVVDGQTIHIILATEGKKFVGMDRPVDELGRITLPMELRKTLNFSEHQKVDISIESNEICIRKVGCIHCSSQDKLIEFKGSFVCSACAHELAALTEG